ncbi:MAG: 50S ribosomal protein L29 [Patescibacteria group bacterium]
MEFKDLQKLNKTELQARLAELRQQVREHRFSIVNNQLKNVRLTRQVKREIAQILTVLNGRADDALPEKEIDKK